MKKKIKIVDEDTLELKEVEIEDSMSEEMYDTFADELRQMLGCESDEFCQKYENYKKAESEFKSIFEPFKKKLIEKYSKTPDIPRNIIIGNTKLTYVSPSTRNSIDSKKLKEEEPEIAKKFTKTTTVTATIRLEDI